jgi:hypothetical protein
MSWGRRARPLGPQVIRIEAPRDKVYDMLRVPYQPGRAPRELRDKVQVLERDVDRVLAAHRTKIGPFTVVTVETVTFAQPDRVDFRLVRGPVSAVVEQFTLRDVDGGAATELRYSGELATDGWGLGKAWGALVGHYWERTVARSLAALKTTAERAAYQRR